MPDFDTWLAEIAQPTHAASRAVVTWARINERPTTITLRRSGVARSPQIVRVELDSRAREDTRVVAGGANAQPGVTRAVIFGVRDHATVADTDIQRGDRVVIAGMEYEVITLIHAPGAVQAICEARV
ncbi:MAG: hypothetical protein GYB67_19335 [Chloroflexi bacterium]|nr:hypothetical protein [Chloroflexota bacterium]